MTREEERRRPVGEDDLQAQVDGRLSPVRQAVVVAYLEAHPDRAAALRDQAAQRDALRAALRFKLDEPIPARLRPDRLVEARRRAARGRIALAASIVLAALVGAGGGWLGHEAMLANDRTAVAETNWRNRTTLAASAHRVYTADAFRPVEIYATAGDLVIRWLSNRLGQPVEAPDLGGVGLRFIGGRLIPTQEGPAGQLMYDDGAGMRVTLFMVPANAGGGGDPAPRFAVIEGVGTVSWADARFRYTAVAAAPEARLEEVAQAVRAALAPKPESLRG